MNQELTEEIEYLIETLTKSGFFSTLEIEEILEDQFDDENIDLSKFSIYLPDSSNENFKKLDNIFKKLAYKGIVGIHNCGFDLSEGVNDTFELYLHLYNNNVKAEGFCFYTLEDVEYAIFDNKLKITFGDFDKNEQKALEMGKTIYKYLNEEFDVIWDESLNSQIEINPFKWDKIYDDEIYEIEGAYERFIEVLH